MDELRPRKLERARSHSGDRGAELQNGTITESGRVK
jgi:hypothetical protein